MKTFQEWSAAGYKINKGSKGQKVGDSWYFSENQVTYSPRRSSYNSTFRFCAPKGTGEIWGNWEDDPDEQDNPLYFDYVGRAY